MRNVPGDFLPVAVTSLWLRGSGMIAYDGQGHGPRGRDTGLGIGACVPVPLPFTDGVCFSRSVTSLMLFLCKTGDFPAVVRGE